MGLLGLVPWRLVGLLALVAGCFGASALAIHNYGAASFARGAASRQADLDAAVAKAQALTLANEQRARADEHAKQEAVDAVASTYQAQLDAEKRDLAAARAGAGQLRDAIYRVATARPDGPAASACAAGGLDGRAAALGDVSASGADLAEDLAADAEHLADQVRGLQAYARSVSAPLIEPHKE